MEGLDTQMPSVEGFVKQFQALLVGESFQEFARLAEENAELKENASRLRIVQEENATHYKELYNQIDDLKITLNERDMQVRSLKDEKESLAVSLTSLKSEKEASEASLNEKIQTATAAIENEDRKFKQLEKNHGDNMKEVQKCKDKISQLMKKQGATEEGRSVAESRADEANSRASKLDKDLTDLRLMTKTLDPRGNDFLAGGISGAFEMLRSITERYFGDLNDTTLKNPGCWEKLSAHEVVSTRIPLAATNSAIAKLMRHAAILCVCSDALIDHIFRPTYTLEDTHELSEILDPMAAREGNKVNFVRSVLLNLNNKNQSEIRNNAIEGAVEAVFDVVHLLLGNLEQAINYKKELDMCFRQLCEHWVTVQTADAVVFSSSKVSVQQNWNLFVNKMGNPDKKGEANRQAANGNKAKAEKQGGGGKGNNDKSRPEADTAALAIWPGFMITRTNSSMELLLKGVALGDSKLREGKDEMYNSPVPSPEAKRRSQRTHKRKQSTSESIGPMSPFLSQD